jgi:hypothetical protein
VKGHHDAANLPLKDAPDFTTTRKKLDSFPTTHEHAFPAAICIDLRAV